MKLWLITQSVNKEYDTYDAVVVAAETEDDAKTIIPGVENWWNEDRDWNIKHYWALPEYVRVKLIGEAIPGTLRGVVLASFNAG